MVIICHLSALKSSLASNLGLIPFHPYVKESTLKYEYDSKSVEALTVKSCRFFARAITDADDHIGVIVVESIDTNFFTRTDGVNFAEELAEEFEDVDGLLSRFIRDAKKIDLEFAQKIL